MEEKNSNKKPKLRMINELSPDAQNYNYGDYDYGCGSGCGCGCGCGECGCGCGCGSQGRGDGSDEANCMSEARYWELCMKNELTTRVYVCGQGWTMPVVMVSGSSGIYTGWGTGASDCMSKDIFDRLSSLGLLKGQVYVCGQGWTWPETNIGSCGCGSCGYGSGSFVNGGDMGRGKAPQTYEEAKLIENVIGNDYVQSVMRALWEEMLNLADETGRLEVGCWMFYDWEDKQIHKRTYEKINGTSFRA